MARTERPPSFQFYPRDFWSDPAVIRLSLAEVGAYWRILGMSWLTDTPGVVLEKDLPGLSGFGRKWPQHAEAIGRCFDRSTPGTWCQKRMLEARQVQLTRYESALQSGRKSQQIQREKRDSLKIMDKNLGTPASASASASASQQTKGLAHARAPERPEPEPTPLTGQTEHHEKLLAAYGWESLQDANDDLRAPQGSTYDTRLRAELENGRSEPLCDPAVARQAVANLELELEGG